MNNNKYNNKIHIFYGVERKKSCWYENRTDVLLLVWRNKNELHPIIEKISPNDMTTIWNKNSGHLIVIQQKTGNTQICQENNNM